MRDRFFQPTRWCCSRCGSEDVTVGAFAKWNVVKQEWQFDLNWCSDCRADCIVEERPITDVKRLAQIAIEKGEPDGLPE
jgi:hypothetical protein